METTASVRAELYYLLAETLAEPPDWLAGAGTTWPLFEAALRLARETGSIAAGQAVTSLAAVRPETMTARQRRYRQVFVDTNCTPVAMSESLWLEGRLLGPTTWAVQQVYQTAGLSVDGAELPDHVSVELAFLGWLAEQEAAHPAQAAEWQKLARSFIKQHAGRWLPALGQSLAATKDSVYAPIGQLLAGWIHEAAHPLRHQAKNKHLLMPVIPQPDDCTLCSFCVQVCPTQALAIYETNTETGLILNPAACIGCTKCERICEFEAIQMEAPSALPAERLPLRISARAQCPHCGQPTVSRAELQAIATQLGEWPAWLDACSDCRAMAVPLNV